MNITDKTEKDPVTDWNYSEAMLRWALIATEDVTGKQGMTVILREAGLQKYIDAYPPEEKKISNRAPMREYAALNAALLSFLGRGGRSIATRIGRNAYRMGLEHYGSLLGAAVNGIKLVPEGQRMRLGLELIKRAFHMIYINSGLEPIRIEIEDCGDHFKWRNYHCANCCGKQSDAPMCYMQVGLLQEGMHWLMGKEFQVFESACRSVGAEACEFQVSKTPKEAA